MESRAGMGLSWEHVANNRPGEADIPLNLNFCFEKISKGDVSSQSAGS